MRVDPFLNPEITGIYVTFLCLQLIVKRHRYEVIPNTPDIDLSSGRKLKKVAIRQVDQSGVFARSI